MTLKVFPRALQGLLSLWSLLSASFSHPARPAACGAAWGCHGDHASMKKEGDVDAKWSRETWLLNSCPWGSGDRQGRCGWMVARRTGEEEAWKQPSIPAYDSLLLPNLGKNVKSIGVGRWLNSSSFGSQHLHGRSQRLITQGLGMPVPKDLRHSPSLL